MHKLTPLLVLIRKITITVIFLGVSIYSWPSMIMPILTFSAITVALFKEELKAFYLSPQLEITISTNPEHFHEADANDIRTGAFVETQAWLGIIINNNGIGSAKNVEAYFTGVDSNRVRDFGRFRSIPLVRSWVGDTIVNSLHPRMTIRFDICYLRRSHPSELSFHFKNTPNALTGIGCPLHEASHFEFNIFAVADNAGIVKRRIKITFEGNYRDGFDAAVIS